MYHVKIIELIWAIRSIVGRFFIPPYHHHDKSRNHYDDIMIVKLLLIWTNIKLW